LENLVQDESKGQLFFLGRRHVVIDPAALCGHLDNLMGAKVAEVVMHSHEYRLGSADAAQILDTSSASSADIGDVIDSLVKNDRVTGVGVTQVDLDERGIPVSVKIENPCVKGTEGAAKSLIASYWCGAFSRLFGVDFEIAEVTYDAQRDILQCRIGPRS
jgi:hypothetical protein